MAHDNKTTCFRFNVRVAFLFHNGYHESKQEMTFWKTLQINRKTSFKQLCVLGLLAQKVINFAKWVKVFTAVYIIKKYCESQMAQDSETTGFHFNIGETL